MNFRKNNLSVYTFDVSDYYTGSIECRQALVEWLTAHKVQYLSVTRIEEDLEGNLKIFHVPEDDTTDSLFGMPLLHGEIIFRIPKELNDFPWNKVLPTTGIKEIEI